MKRLSLLHLIAATPILCFVGCSTSGKSNRTNTVQTTGTKNMTRHKTASGLEYEIIKEGTGNSPVSAKKVTVHYTGWLNKDGKPDAKFDSSLDRMQPFSFVIGKGMVIQGWDEGVMSMKVGEKRRLFLPASLAYGSRGAGAVIKPNSNLIFDVELLKVD